MATMNDDWRARRSARRFRRAYARLAIVGRCDSPGGMEYRRVRREWFAAGRPEPVEAFIQWRANAGPDDDYTLTTTTATGG